MTTKIKKGSPKSSPNRKTRRELGSWLSQVEANLTARLDQLDKTNKILAQSMQTMWANQKELSRSEELLDEQFAVSTRMTIVAVNHILEKMNLEDRITEQDIEKLFRDWAQFRARPDYRELMMEWFLGVALDKLPPPKQRVEKEGDSHVEGNLGNQKDSEGGPQSGGQGQANDVPQVSPKDGAATQP